MHIIYLFVDPELICNPPGTLEFPPSSKEGWRTPHVGQVSTKVYGPPCKRATVARQFNKPEYGFCIPKPEIPGPEKGCRGAILKP